MTQKLIKLLLIMKSKGLHIFLFCVLIFAFCFHGPNPSAETASVNIDAGLKEQQTDEEKTEATMTIFSEAVPEADRHRFYGSASVGPKALTSAETAVSDTPESKTSETQSMTAVIETTVEAAEETTAEETSVEMTGPIETSAYIETTVAETTVRTEAITESAPPSVQISGNYGQRSQEQWEIDYADSLFDLVNAERAGLGLAPLKKMDALTSAATDRAWEVSFYNSHTRPDGTRCFTVLPQYGLNLSGRAENIAYCSSTPQAALNSLMSNWAHKEPMISSKFEYMGVGFYYVHNDPYGYGYYWTQIFYTP